MRVHAEAIDAVLETKRDEAIGQFDLFGGGGEPDGGAGARLRARTIPVGEWDKTVLLAAEREMLGLYVSDHPLLGVEHVLAGVADCSIAALTDRRGPPDGAIVTIAGLVTGLQRKITKQGNAWAHRDARGPRGRDRGACSSRRPTSWSRPSSPRTPSSSSGAGSTSARTSPQADRDGDDAARPVASASAARSSSRCRPPRCIPPVVERLKEVLATHPGVTEVHLQLQSAARAPRVLRLDDGLRVAAVARRCSATSRRCSAPPASAADVARFVLVPGFWLGGWAWDSVASSLRAAGHDVEAVTLPGLESLDADRSAISLDDHIRRRRRRAQVRAPGDPGRAQRGRCGGLRRDRPCARRWFQRGVYVDQRAAARRRLPWASPPTRTPTEIPLPTWPDLAANGSSLDGLDDAQLAEFRSQGRSAPGRAGP